VHIHILWLVLLGVLWCSTAWAQLWNGYLTPTTATNGRGIDWQGMVFTPPNTSGWTQCGATIAASGATAATINSRIASCGANQYVLLGAGTFNLSSSINISSKSNVVLRGSGTAATIINNTGQGGCAWTSTIICIDGVNGNWTGTMVNKTITSGLAPGARSLTLNNVTGLSVGQIVWVNQADEDKFASYAPFIIGAPYNPGGTPVGQVNDRGTAQGVRITAITGNTITLERGLYYTRFSQSLASPAVSYWPVLHARNIGVEDMTIKRNGTPSGSGPNSVVELGGVDGAWVKNVAMHFCANYCISLFSTYHVTIFNNYLFQHPLDNTLSNRYGIVMCCGATDTAIYNNICQEIQACIMGNGASQGTVLAYNFARNQPWNGNGSGSTSNNSAIYPTHSLGQAYWLIEGNDVNAITYDDDHGVGCCMVVVRNNLHGRDFDQTLQTVQRNIPVISQAYNRWMSYFGNVLGTQGVTGTYQSVVGAPVGSNLNDNVAWSLGWSCCPNEGTPTDAVVVTSTYRWGNYDTATGTNRFVAGEVPSDQTVPASQSVPASFYLSSKPSWFGSNVWPPIGPDVTGGSVSGYGGRVHRIPARVCYEDVMGGPANGFTGTTPLPFNPTTCYGAGGGGDVIPPVAPSGLRVL